MKTGIHQLQPLACLCFLLMISLFFSCNESTSRGQKPNVEILEAAFKQFRESSITHRRFKHSDILPLIKARKEDFRVEELGKSVQGREIFQLGYGEGQTKVLLWSQMHGNESTATMALFDLFNFLEGEDDDFDSVRSLLKNNLDIRFIPMVNPDGAEVFQRRNALDIDLNRDALKETSPEAALLKAARDDFEPEFGFNLHDQQIYYNVKGTANPATISVLAPAYNEAAEINEVRGNAMRIIVGVNNLLQQIIPGQVGKYDDAFEPRAFGDNFQKWGTSTVLIESGGFQNDTEKQYIRKLNFMVILHALYTIAVENYSLEAIEDYYSIPDNDSKLVDVLLKNVVIEQKGQNYQVDLGIKRTEMATGTGFYVSGTIADVGDLSVFYGYSEIEADGMSYKVGNIWNGTFNSLAEVSEEKALELLKQGYIAIRVANAEKDEIHGLPLIVLKDRKNLPSGHKVGNAANFFLQKNEELVFAVVNGYLIDLKNPLPAEWRQRIL